MDSKELNKIVSYAKRVNSCDDEYNSSFNADHKFGDRSHSELMGILARGVLALNEKNKLLRAKIKEVNNASA